jgi:hypothetical protein
VVTLVEGSEITTRVTAPPSGGGHTPVTWSGMAVGSGDVVLVADNAAVIDATNAAVVQSDGITAAAILAINTIGWARSNLFLQAIDAILGSPYLQTAAYGGAVPARTEATVVDTTIAAAAAVRIVATGSAAITATVTNKTSSLPKGLFSATGMSVGAVLASSLVNSAVRASASRSVLTGDHVAPFTADIARWDRVWTDPTSLYLYLGTGPRGPPFGDLDDDTIWQQLNSVTAGGSISIAASDSSTIDAMTRMLGVVSPTNDAGAGIINGFLGALLNAYDFTSNSGSRWVKFGDEVRVADDHPVTAVAGKVFRFMGTDRTVVLSEAVYTDFELWRELTPANLMLGSVAYAALGEIGSKLNNSTLNGGSKSFAALIARNEVRTVVSATANRVHLDADGDVRIAADLAAHITSLDDSVVQAWNGYGGVVVANTVLADAEASVTSGRIVSGGDVTVSARSAATIDATASSKMEGWDAKSVVIAFNAVGWKPGDIFFNLVTTILGDAELQPNTPFHGPQPIRTVAALTDTPVTAAGDLRVTATAESSITAVVGNENTMRATVDLLFSASAGKGDYDAKKNPTGSKSEGYGASGSAGGLLVASNKVFADTDASITFTGSEQGEVTAGGALEIVAEDAVTIISTSTVVQDVVTKNDLSGVVGIVNSILIPGQYDYTTASGQRQLSPKTDALLPGDRVRLGAGYTGGGQPGAVYEYIGLLPQTFKLGEVDYDEAAVTDPLLKQWRKVVVEYGTWDGLESLYPGIGNFTDSDARAVGILIVLNDVRGSAEALLDNAVVTAAAVLVRAWENATLRALATTNVSASGGSFYGTGTVTAYGGQLATNVVLSSAVARIEDSDVTTTAGAVVVDARNTSILDARILTTGSSGGTAGMVTLAFNTIGWGSQNVLFNALDTIIGRPGAENPDYIYDVDTPETLEVDARVLKDGKIYRYLGEYEEQVDSAGNRIWVRLPARMNVDLTQEVYDDVLYQWSAGTQAWNQVTSGSTLPTSPTAGQAFILTAKQGPTRRASTSGPAPSGCGRGSSTSPLHCRPPTTTTACS